MMTTIKTYREMILFPNYIDRFNYLKIKNLVGDITFGGHRYINQRLYQLPEWKRIRRQVILRDNACDLGHPDYPINGRIYVHHINPITIDDILEYRDLVFDPNNLISTSFDTHNAIHYGDDDLLIKEPIVRKPGDTCPWR